MRGRRAGRILQLPRRLGLKRFAEELERLGAVSVESVQAVTRTYVDTFDWRLFGEGMIFYEQEEGGERRLVLARLPGETAVRRLQGALPEFARDLRESSFRSALAAVTEPRLLLPLVTLRVETRTWSLSDMDGQVVARVVAATYRATREVVPRGRLLPRRVRVEPLAGEASRTRGLTAFFKIHLKMAPPARSLFEEAMAAVNLHPGDYSSKVSIPIDPKAPAQETLRHILSILADAMEKNVPGSCRGRDPEFLHDFRVAVRRSRSALGQLKKVLPPERVALFRGEFAWLQDVTGPARDMDVYLLGLPGYRRSLPRREARSLAPLEEFLRERAREARAAAAAALRSERFEKLLRAYRDFLAAAVNPGTETPLAAVPTGELAQARIWKVYRQAVAEGRHITADSPVDELHELRKTCKKLRYLMEFFRTLFPARSVDRLIRELKKLQDNLGDFNDLQVQSDYLDEVAGLLEKGNSVPPNTFMALGRLIESMHWRSVQEQEKFLACFDRFDSGKNRRLFRKLFRRKMPAGFAVPRDDGQGGHAKGD